MRQLTSPIDSMIIIDPHCFLVAKHPSVQVSVDPPLKQRLELLAAAHGLSVSSYVRVVINRHILAVDRQEQASSFQSLDEFYRTL